MLTELSKKYFYLKKF